MINNYINGNLADAKRQAKQFSLWQIYVALKGHYSRNKAAAIAYYLKYPSQRTFDAACNADNP